MLMEAMATREAYGKALVELGSRMEKVVVLMPIFKIYKTALFAEKFRCDFLTWHFGSGYDRTAAGPSGFIPYSTGVFATENLRPDTQFHRLYPPECKIASHTGITVEKIAPHQALEDIALMRVLPNMTVVVPADGRQTFQAVEAIAAFEGPVYLRLGRLAVPQVIPENLPFELGKAQLLREGNDLLIVAAGLMVGTALEAAECWKGKALVQLLRTHTIKPLTETFGSDGRRTGALLQQRSKYYRRAWMHELLAETVLFLRMVGMWILFESRALQTLLEYGLTANNLAAAGKKALEIKKSR